MRVCLCKTQVCICVGFVYIINKNASCLVYICMCILLYIDVLCVCWVLARGGAFCAVKTATVSGKNDPTKKPRYKYYLIII